MKGKGKIITKKNYCLLGQWNIRLRIHGRHFKDKGKMLIMGIFKFESKFFNKGNKFTLDTNIIKRLEIVTLENEEESKNRKTGTKVIFPVNKIGQVYGFMVYGYTGYAVKGYDIVSSAISMLCYHTINTIRRHTNDLSEEKIADGIILFSLPNLKNGIGSDVAKILLTSMVSSMLDIQKDYDSFMKEHLGVY